MKQVKSVSLLAVLAVFCGASCNALVQPSSRRDVLTNAMGAFGLASVIISPLAAFADGELSDEDMAARIARKKELQNMAASRGQSQFPTGSDIRSDVNPEAGGNLRSRTFVENTKIAVAKQDELKKRNKKQKAEDMCEMLGRGC